MCGLAGFVEAKPRRSGSEQWQIVQRMAASIRHRGPDSGGGWLDADAGVALGHRRLAIIDLSDEGRQPMVSASGRFVISYNGEVYNYHELRGALVERKHVFRGHSDTEILLAAIEHWGLEEALGKLAGMFAFALWDRSERTLHLVRDRLGKKPLYFGWAGSVFLFASELKALRPHPDLVPEVDRDALALFLRHGYVPAPHSILRGIHKLPPGSLLSLPFGRGCDPRAVAPLSRVRSYWSTRAVVAAGLADPLDLADDEAGEQLDMLLQQAVGQRMMADVPLGAFLSGGIDSSLVVALMQRHAARPVKTFTIGFHEAGHDEAQHAKEVARHLGTDHAELYLASPEAQSIIPQLPEMYDEPFADASQIPTLLVARFARADVTVALTGDGGDEAFAGYTRHHLGPRLWARLHLLPRPLRQVAATTLTSVAARHWDSAAAAFNSFLPRSRQLPAPGAQIHKLADLLCTDESSALYRNLTSQWREPEAVVIDGREPATTLTDPMAGLEADALAHELMYYDTISYLPDDILVKVDRASMAVSLEARAPLLDHRLVEFAWRLPLRMKLRHGRGKWLLRRVLERYLPPVLFERPKHGFTVPIGAWLRGSQREWAEALLAPERLAAEGYLREAPIRRAWGAHLAGRGHAADALWTVLMFQAWHERWCAEPRLDERGSPLVSQAVA